MSVPIPTTRIAVAAALLAAAGCSATPPPESASPPPAAPATGAADTRPFVSGAYDSVASIPGSPSAPYYYRFQMIAPPGAERFSYQDRELSFYFKPAPDAIHFQVENRQNRPVWIDWERSVFHDPVGGTGEVAHETTRFEDRFQAQPQTQIPGQGRYGDYLLPLSYLIDPSGSNQQLHRPLLPEDATSQEFKDKIFGVDLVFMVEDRPRTYSFRFRVASVIAR